MSPAISGVRLVVRAAAIAADAHSGQLRDEGAPYVEHPLRVARILAEEAAVEDPNLLAAAVLHDVLEDAPDPDAVRARIREEIGQPVLTLVELLTKPPSGRNSREERDRAYLERLRAGPPEAVTIKLADRLDNVRSLRLNPDRQKRARYVAETEAHYLPLVNETGILAGGFRRALAELRSGEDGLLGDAEETG